MAIGACLSLLASTACDVAFFVTRFSCSGRQWPLCRFLRLNKPFQTFYLNSWVDLASPFSVHTLQPWNQPISTM